MPKLEKNAIRFDSADKTNSVAGFFYTDPAIEPFCVVQISHGMCEFIARYEHFAAFLTQKGVAVCGNDHLGHGDTAANEGDFGYFTEKHGRKFAIADLKTMNDRAHQRFPGLPVILLGHSMGSFFARQYAVEYPKSIAGLIISGTGGPNPLAGFGIAMTELMQRVKGMRHRSTFVQKLALGSYTSRIENAPTGYEWISRDEEAVKVYVADPRCTFLFTVNGFGELFRALKDVSGPDWAPKIAKEMPILMISGDADPVGDYGKGVAKVREMLETAGVKHITYHIYPGARHEVLNEINNAEVYEDVLAFLRQWWG